MKRLLLILALIGALIVTSGKRCCSLYSICYCYYYTQTLSVLIMTSDYSGVMVTGRETYRSALMEPGVGSVITALVLLMLKLPVSS